MFAILENGSVETMLRYRLRFSTGRAFAIPTGQSKSPDGLANARPFLRTSISGPGGRPAAAELGTVNSTVPARPRRRRARARAKHTRSYVAFFPTKRQIPPGRGPVNSHRRGVALPGTRAPHKAMPTSGDGAVIDSMGEINPDPEPRPQGAPPSPPLPGSRTEAASWQASRTRGTGSGLHTR